MNRNCLFNKAIALLLCAFMLIGFLPSVALPAAATETDDKWESDLDVHETEAPTTEPPVAGSKENPITLLLPDFEYNIPAGETVYFQSARLYGSTLNVTGNAGWQEAIFEVVYNETTYASVESECDVAMPAADPMMPPMMATPIIFAVTNKNDFAVDYVINGVLPVGIADNPYEVGDSEEITVDISANSDGYFFRFMNYNTGILTITVESESNFVYAITNETTSVGGDIVFNDSTPVSFDYTAEDSYFVMVNTSDMSAGQITVKFDFIVGQGTEAAPFMLLDMHNEVSIPAGETVWYVCYNDGLYMTVSGADFELNYGDVCVEDSEYTTPDVITYPDADTYEFVFSVTNVTEADATYAIDFTYPEGTYENPDEAVLGDNSAATSGEYYFEYVAEEDGNLIFTMNTESNWYYNVAVGAYGEYGFEAAAGGDECFYNNSEKTVTYAVTKGQIVRISVKAVKYVEYIVEENDWSYYEDIEGSISFNLKYEKTECEHNYIAELVSEPTNKVDGKVVYTCEHCGDSYDLVLPGGSSIFPRFRAKSLALESDLTVVFWMDQGVINAGYKNVYAVFEIDGVETTLQLPETVDSDGFYKFNLAAVAPRAVNSMINITIHATYEGYEYVRTENYTVMTYCKNALVPASTDKMKTLIVDLLYYSAAQQVYTNYNTENLSTSILADGAEYHEYDAYKTSTETTWTNNHARQHITIENPAVKISGVTLVLESAVEMQFFINNLKDVEDLSAYEIKMETADGREFVINGNDFFVDPLYTNYQSAVFNKLVASEMRKLVYLTVYQNGVAISDTMQTSIESFVARSYVDGSSNLDKLMVAMLRYGDSAAAYFS